MILQEASLLNICSSTTKYIIQPQDCFRGRILQPSLLKKNGVASYSFTLASIDPGEGDISIRVELRGAGLVDQAYREEILHRLSDGVKIALQGQGGRCVELQGNGGEGMRRVKIVYEEEITGWFLLREGKEERFVVRKPTPPEVQEERSQSVNSVKPEPKVDAKPFQTPAPPSKPVSVDSKAQEVPLAQAVASTSTGSKKRKSDKVDDGAESTRTGSVSGLKKTVRKRSPSPVIVEEELDVEESWNVQPPSTFTSLADIKAHGKNATSYNIASVIESVEIFPPKRDGDWFAQIYITDPTISPQCCEIQFYEREKKMLPDFKKGNVLLVKGLRFESAKFKKSSRVFIETSSIDPASLIRLSAYPERPPFYSSLPEHSATRVGTNQLAYAVALATFESIQRIPSWVRNILKPILIQAPTPTVDSTAIAARSSLFSAQPAKTTNSSHTSRPSTAAPPPRAPVPTGSSFPSRSGRPILEIKDIKERQFCDLFGQILKVHIEDNRIPSSYPVCLFITDYTSHSELMNYNSTSASNTGVIVGQQTLQISLFENQALPLKSLVGKGIGGEMKVGDFVRADNVRVKRNDNGLLEGTVIDDAKYKDKRYVSLIGKQESLKVPEIARLLHRKKEQGR
ncbi:hypothetical protein JCM5353_001380 [Sporobolomyces roseus]